jgi:hypothetical protein
MKIAAFFLCEKVGRDANRRTHIVNASITQLNPRPKPVKLALYACVTPDVGGEAGRRTLLVTGKLEGASADLFSMDINGEIYKNSLKGESNTEVEVQCVAGRCYVFRFEIVELGLYATWRLEILPENHPDAL